MNGLIYSFLTLTILTKEPFTDLEEGVSLNYLINQLWDFVSTDIEPVLSAPVTRPVPPPRTGWTSSCPPSPTSTSYR